MDRETGKAFLERLIAPLRQLGHDGIESGSAPFQSVARACNSWRVTLAAAEGPQAFRRPSETAVGVQPVKRFVLFLQSGSPPKAVASHIESHPYGDVSVPLGRGASPFLLEVHHGTLEN